MKKQVLDMTAKKSREAQKVSLDIVRDRDFRYFMTAKQKTLSEYMGLQKFTMKPGHYITDMKKINLETLRRAHEYQPKSYEEMVALKGMGPKTVRALALISDLVYGKQASWKDPVRYSFAHGGKDGVPYPVNKRVYDKSVSILKNAIRQAKLGEKDRLHAIRRLEGWIE